MKRCNYSFLAGLAVASLSSAAAASTGKTPTVEGLVLESTASSAGMSLGNCKLQPKEKQLALMLLQHPAQARGNLTCNPVLQAFARQRALDMVKRQYFGHVTPDNIGPNDQLRQFGYPLPDFYGGGRDNAIEALVGGGTDANDVLQRLLDSPAHRSHLLGEDTFYREQDEFGIAYHYAWDTPHMDHWVIVIARRARDSDPDVMCLPPPGGCMLRSGNMRN